MIALYIFSLIVGGGILALSVLGDLFGGHADVDFDGDLGGLDGHLELDAGGLDLDAGGLDLDAGGLDVDAGGLDMDAGHLDFEAAHVDADAAHAELDVDAQHLASKLFSIRALIYSLFGFGAVGTLLTFIWSASPGMTAAFAVVGGLTCGTLINALFGWVRGSESGALLGEAGYVGFVGRMTLPIRGGTPGKLVVERAGRRIELRALPHPSAKGNPADWKDVFVVEMEKGVARVAPFDEDMLLKP